MLACRDRPAKKTKESAWADMAKKHDPSAKTGGTIKGKRWVIILHKRLRNTRFVMYAYLCSFVPNRVKNFKDGTDLTSGVPVS